MMISPLKVSHVSWEREEWQEGVCLRNVVFRVRLSWGHVRTTRSGMPAQHTGAVHVCLLNVLPCVGRVLGRRDLVLTKTRSVAPSPPPCSLRSSKRRDWRLADE